MTEVKNGAHCRHRKSILWFGGIILFCAAQSGADSDIAGMRGANRWALIIVGIPGDREHETVFRQTAEAWRNWLVQSVRIPPNQIIQLPGLAESGQDFTSVNAESIRQTVSELAHRLQPDDSLWVFTLGHGNYDGRHAWLHVQGRDPSQEDFGRWFGDVRCREQVFWLTHASSGWFVRPLSRRGRIVVAATAADDESNETEFPRALAYLVRQQTEFADEDAGERISVADLFQAVRAEVQRRFDSDRRLSTEHAQLDDNGDGRGTESLELGNTPTANSATPPTRSEAKDGELARDSWIPWKTERTIPAAPADKPRPGSPSD